MGSASRRSEQPEPPLQPPERLRHDIIMNGRSRKSGPMSMAMHGCIAIIAVFSAAKRSIGAADPPAGVQVIATVKPDALLPGTVFELSVTIEVPHGWITYDVTQALDSAAPTQIYLDGSEWTAPLEPFHGPPPRQRPDSLFQGRIARYFHSSPTFRRRMLLSGAAKAGPITVSGQIDFQVCDERTGRGYVIRRHRFTANAVVTDKSPEHNAKSAGRETGNGDRDEANSDAETARGLSFNWRPAQSNRPRGPTLTNSPTSSKRNVETQSSIPPEKAESLAAGSAAPTKQGLQRATRFIPIEGPAVEPSTGRSSDRDSSDLESATTIQLDEKSVARLLRKLEGGAPVGTWNMFWAAVVSIVAGCVTGRRWISAAMKRDGCSFPRVVGKSACAAPVIGWLATLLPPLWSLSAVAIVCCVAAVRSLADLPPKRNPPDKGSGGTIAIATAVLAGFLSGRPSGPLVACLVMTLTWTTFGVIGVRRASWLDEFAASAAPANVLRWSGSRVCLVWVVLAVVAIDQIDLRDGVRDWLSPGAPMGVCAALAGLAITCVHQRAALGALGSVHFCGRLLRAYLIIGSALMIAAGVSDPSRVARSIDDTVTRLSVLALDGES
jgi:hypothetical protein